MAPNYAAKTGRCHNFPKGSEFSGVPHSPALCKTAILTPPQSAPGLTGVET